MTRRGRWPTSYWLLPLKVRRVIPVVAGMAGTATLTGLTSTGTYAFANAVGEALTPLASLMPAVCACLVAVGCRPALAGGERMGGARLTVTVNTLLPSLTVIAIMALVFGHSVPALVHGEPISFRLAPHVMVATLGWTGLAMLSSMLAGDTLAWVLPSLSIGVVTLFGYGADGSARFWNIAAQQPTRGPVITALVLYGAAWALWNLMRYQRCLPLLRRV